MRKKSVALKYPIEFEGKRITHIEIRSPKVKDYKEAMMAKSEEEMTLISKLTGCPIEMLEELEMIDFKQLQEALLGFLEE